MPAEAHPKSIRFRPFQMAKSAFPDLAGRRPSRLASLAPQGDGTSVLRKQYRRQLSAAFDGCFVSRTPGVEELHELLACAIVVPFAVALDDGDQLTERFGTLALTVERQRQVE